MEKQRHTVLLRTLCFVFNEKNQVLLIERASDKFDAGMYNALGGHVEKGEDIIHSAEREIYEESGITPRETSLIGLTHVSDFFGKNIVLFVTKSITDTNIVKSSQEGTLVWVDLHNIDDYKIYEDIKPFLKRIVDDKDMFIGTSKFDGKGRLLEFNIRDF